MYTSLVFMTSIGSPLIGIRWASDTEINELKATFSEVRSHPNQRYWLLKTICLNNLFGLDLMGEASEIAKLRLFLKLVAQLDDVSQIEPLPDLDFNIKTGNLLVGIADPEDVARRFGDVLQSFPGLAAAEQAAQLAADAYGRFTAAQLSEGSAEGVSGKRRLTNQIQAATHQADNTLFDMRGEAGNFEGWKNSHVPFHWFAEFPSVWRHGGFDVVIGNPPYINKKQVTEYTWRGYATEKCPDLYALCMERALTLLNERGRMAMIVMHNMCFSKDYVALREYLVACLPSIWVSSYARRPDSLFAGSANVRSSILLAAQSNPRAFYTSSLRRWSREGRPVLFRGLEYVPVEEALRKCGVRPQWPFIDSEVISASFCHLVRTCEPLKTVLVSTTRFGLAFKVTALYMLGVYSKPPPVVTEEGEWTISKRDGWLYFPSSHHRDLALIILVGRWAYLWWCIFGDGFHVTRGLLWAVPCDIERLVSALSCDMEAESLVIELLQLGRDLNVEMPKHLAWERKLGKKIGRYDLRKLRHITDEADWLLAQAWGLTWEQYEAAGNLRDRMTFGSRD